MSTHRRRAAVLTACVAVMLPAVPVADAHAARVCVKRAVVRDSPGGFTVGYVFRRDRVRVVRRSPSRRWVRVVTPTDLRGWMTSRSLCR